MTRAALAAVLLVALSLALATGAAADTPAEQITWAVHTTLVPTYFDPAETTIGTSFMVLYALHDGVVKPMPGKPLAPSLAESWSVSADGLVYDFVLRRGVKFHHGDPVTAEDVKFSSSAIAASSRAASRTASPRSRHPTPHACASGYARRGPTS